MYNIAIFISGISIVLSVFLVTIIRGVSRRRRAKILRYIAAVFVVILISNIVYVLQTFSILPTTGYETSLFLTEQLIILMLFYAGIARGM